MSRRAIIAGAGIGGLAAALALSRARFDVTLYESAEALEEFGAGLQLTPNATHVLSDLGVLDRVKSFALRTRAIIAIRGSDDAVLMRMPINGAVGRGDTPYLTIHRADLQRALAEAARRQPNVKLCFGSTVAEIETNGDRISVGVKQGATTIHDSADLLIGADGLRSRVRERFRFGKADRLAFCWVCSVPRNCELGARQFRLDPTGSLLATRLPRASCPLSDAWRINSKSRCCNRVDLAQRR